MNPEAELLTQQLLELENVNGAAGRLPSEIMELCRDLQKELSTTLPSEECEKIAYRRITGDGKCPVLLRGFLLQDSNQIQDTRILILMESLGRRARVVPAQAKERFRLTEREQEIVKHLAEGRTNKEIAKLLAISEHTVKEHIRHLLKKTKTSTRTAVLAQIYRDS